jgi:coenzyme F420-0:L-glutamate ligase/coenzyme F420-1:gamma-L-glutamate ligase
MELRIAGLKTLPEVKPGDALDQLLHEAATREGRALGPKTVLVVAQKVVSKAEGALVDLRNIQPSEFAIGWAKSWNKDPRVIELVLRESKRVVKMDRGVIVAETHHGFVTANAGVDQSNIPGNDFAALLPKNPDESARRLRIKLNCGAVIISDTFGRPWREGLINVAIGVSGFAAIEDLRGKQDRDGRSLSATILARADELAGAAGLVMPKAEGVPAALIDGYEWEPGEGSAQELIRSPHLDLFR